MDNPTTLLVAIMFVTIVVTGLVTVLMSLSGWATGQQPFAPLHGSWLLFLLVTYFLYFWNTTLILGIEGWTFLSFAGFILGPIALLFATNLLVVPPEGEGRAEMDRHYFDSCKRFFLLLFMVQAWLVGLDFSFASVDHLTYLAGLTGLVFLALSVSSNGRVHYAGAAVAWIALLIQVVQQSLD
jgi:hypothetical protein